MRIFKFAGSLVFLLTFLATAAFAQGKSRDAVRITCSCDDAVGKAYVSALRSALSESKHFREVAAGEELDQDPIRISIVSLSIGDGPNGQPRTVISVVSIRGGAITHQLIQTCNKMEVESSAQAKLVELVNWK